MTTDDRSLMSDTMPSPDPAEELAIALSRRDTTTAARLARSVRYGVEVVDDMPTTGVVGERRVLLCFVTFAAWERFASAAEIRLVSPEELAALASNVQVDDVLFEPSTEHATQVPVPDVLALLRGETRDDAGQPVLVGDVQVLPFPALHDRLVEVATPGSLPSAAWALCQITAGGSVPLIAVGPDLDDADVIAMVDALKTHDLPADLEVVRVGADEVEHMAAHWQDVRL